LEEVKKMVGVGDIKSTIATAIAAAFGFIIALIWRDIVNFFTHHYHLMLTWLSH